MSAGCSTMDPVYRKKTLENILNMKIYYRKHLLRKFTTISLKVKNIFNFHDGCRKR